MAPAAARFHVVSAPQPVHIAAVMWLEPGQRAAFRSAAVTAEDFKPQSLQGLYQAVSPNRATKCEAMPILQ